MKDLNIKERYEFIKNKIKQRRQWKYRFEALSDYDYKLQDFSKKLEAYKESLKGREKEIEKKFYKYENQIKAENYVRNDPITFFFKKTFMKNPVLFILLTKTKNLEIHLKKVDNYTIKHKGSEYKIITDNFVRSGRFQCAFFLEDKLEQLAPSYLDKSPISSKNFSRIFDDTLISKVFSPQNPSGKFNWWIILLIGVAIIAILHFTGVIDLGEIYNQLIGAMNAGGSASNNQTAAGVIP